ncbi:hypothetical protein GGI43DRAFT_47651 [Trichoderma evansii]
MKSLKRELPQSATQPEPKRRPLSERALEYPSKPSLIATPKIPRSVKGQTLASISQLKQPRPASALANPTPISSFAKSIGPGRNSALDRPSVPRPNTRAHARSVSQIGRPRSAYGHREEEEQDKDTKPNMDL